MKLIVGLGNPGDNYKKTRHNVGFMVVDKFAKDMGLSFNKEKFNGLYFETYINNEKVLVLKPLSYMNLSGEVVSKFVSYYNINISDILIINDDLALDVAKIRLRPYGSSGGHNGLKNIEFHLNSSNYKRLRIGIGKNTFDIKDYVLGKFNNDDYNRINDILPLTSSIINEFCLNNDFSKLMSKYN